MEAAISNVDLGRYRRIVQMFWDPEPTNDASQDHPVWCLGRSYKLSDTAFRPTSRTHTQATRDGKITAFKRSDGGEEDKHSVSETDVESLPSALSESGSKPLIAPLANLPQTPPESASSSFSSSLAYEEPGSEAGWPQAFIDDFESKFWMTYRSDFVPIARSTDPKANSALSFSMRIKSQLGDQAGFSSDSGWGCMIRSGQSLLANAMGRLSLGRDWRRGQKPREERQLLSLFADDPAAPYSIHNFVRHGAEACGKYPGEWFGPSATARCIQDLTNSRKETLRVYSTGDGPDVYEEAFMKIAQDGDEFHPTLILVGTRLGIDKVTPVYWEALIASLQLPHSIGIAGGRPSSSHYFIGAQGEHLFYLDPHHTRKAFPYYSDASPYTDEDIDSCHTTRLRRIHVKEMDPSMLIGFLIQSREEWVDWRRSVKHVQGKAIIHVADQDPRLRGSRDARDEAIDEVETLSDEEDDADTIQDI